MYQRFTDRSRVAMQLANVAAQRCRHEFVGAEHVLLGIMDEGNGVAVQVLRKLGVDFDDVRQTLNKVASAAPDAPGTGQKPMTPRVKAIIEHAVGESTRLRHEHVGTEHLLMGILKEQDNAAAQVLRDSGVTLDDVYKEVQAHAALKPTFLAGIKQGWAAWFQRKRD